MQTPISRRTMIVAASAAYGLSALKASALCLDSVERRHIKDKEARLNRAATCPELFPHLAPYKNIWTIIPQSIALV